MNKHKKQDLESITCPFVIEIKSADWNEVKAVSSLDDKENSVIIEMNNGEKFLVDVPKILYDAIYKSGEDNVIEQDMGFNDMT